MKQIARHLRFTPARTIKRIMADFPALQQIRTAQGLKLPRDGTARADRASGVADAQNLAELSVLTGEARDGLGQL